MLLLAPQVKHTCAPLLIGDNGIFKRSSFTYRTLKPQAQRTAYLANA
ncbi:hypothetical protein T02_9334 [Trichinella nativa]|uniref:Uncharacterized protein n=1 Tax=Trichinella nativa TaxID=6335 RepID=A0A0V1KJS6_9BILA|nr:hypothetical protein T02_9334 [Trichinella nativa]